MLNLLKKTSIVFLSVTIALVIYSTKANAAVRFLMDREAGTVTTFSRGVPSCPSLGYSLRNCIGNQTPQNFCPSNKAFFKKCGCDSKKYKYNSYNCPYPKKLYGETCDGKYEACKCEDKFKYDSTNCPSPKSLSGMSCNGKYESCSCPSEYFKNCSGNMVGEGNSCGGKYKSCKCASIYKNCSEGQETNSSICIEQTGVIKYSQCKSNSCENAGYIPSVPENEKCSQIKYAGRICYKDCRPITCADGGFYENDLPSNIKCPVVKYANLSCYNCDGLCGYCDKFSGKCKVDCMNDCKKSLWFENTLNGAFTCQK